MRVRQANFADVPAMMKLERESPSAAHWPQQQYENMFLAVRIPQQSQRLGWIVENDPPSQPREAFSRTPGILAFLIARRVDSEWELENIVVTETLRRRGVGTLLLRQFVAGAQAGQGSSIFLEVRQSNHSARALYRTAGLQETGVRKSYYSDPREDAILYRLNLY